MNVFDKPFPLCENFFKLFESFFHDIFKTKCVHVETKSLFCFRNILVKSKTYFQIFQI